MHLFSQAGGRLRYDDDARPRSCPTGAAGARSPARQRVVDAGGCLADGAAAEAADGRVPAPSRSRRRCRRRRSHLPLWLWPGAGRRLPAPLRRPAARRHRRRPRAARPAPGMRSRRARQALHDDRHRARPGQDVGRADALGDRRRAARRGRSARSGTTTFRPPYTPVAFAAARRPRPRRAARPGRVTTPCTRGTSRTARCSRTSASGSGPWYYPRPGEDMDGRRAARVPRRPRGRRRHGRLTLGKIDVQGPDARRVPRPALHQRDEHADGRARAATA